MRSRAEWSAGLPRISIVPESGPRTFITMRRVVVLPAPFGPSRPNTLPRGTSRDRSFTATWPANALVTPPRRERLRLWGLGLVFVTNTFTYFTALQTVPAATVALLIYSYPVIVTLLAALAGLEILRLRSLVAALLAFAGCALTASGPLPAAPGVGYALVTAVIYAVYIVLGSRF